MKSLNKLILAVASAAFFVAPALAQNVGTVTSNAFAVGRGAGKQGFASVLCTQAQLAVGQNAAVPICRTLTGDVTIDAAGVTTIGASKVTNAQLATAAAGTIKSNITGGTAVPSDNSISAVLDNLLGTTRGSVIYRGASAWSSLGPSTSGFFLKTNGAGADPAWAAASGSGTVTSVGLTNTYGLSVSGSPVTVSGNISAGVSLTTATNCLSGNTSMSSTVTYFDGPSMAQGTTGTWYASGTVTLNDSSASASNFYCKLWDGTTVISSGNALHPATANLRATITLSGILASPAANIRISCANQDTTTSVFEFNRTGNSKDSCVFGFRIQ